MGDVINYSFLITNIGSVQLDNIVVTDTFITGAIDCFGQTSLASSNSFTCSAQHIVTQANIDNDVVFVNTANVTATPTEGTIGNVSGMLSIPGPAVEPILTVTKTASKTVDAVLNDLITYTYTVKNDGFITIDNVIITDNHLGSGSLSVISSDNITVNSNGLSTDSTINGVIDTLAPGDSATFTSTYTINQDDINAGTTITNTATATGNAKRGTLVDPTANASVALETRNPELILSKTPSVSSGVAAGDLITYTYLLNNIGNTTINSIEVSDVHNGSGTLSAISCLNTSLLPASSTTCTASYTVTQTDINAGTAITNTATATGTPPTGSTLTNPTASASVTTATPVPALTITKTANDTTDVVVGQNITYTYVVRNTGNVTFDNVSVADSHSGLGTSPNPSNEVLANNSGSSVNTTANDGNINQLAPGDSVSLTASYTVTQEDIDAGVAITNTATANGSPQTGVGFIPPNATVIVDPISQNGLIDIQKVAGAPTINLGADTALTDPLDTITYTLTAKNMGNVTLTNVIVSDTLLTVASTDCAVTSEGDTFNNDGSDTLDVGESVVCTVTYVLDQTDIDTGVRPNTASADALDQNTNIVNDSTTVNSSLQQKTSIELIKTAGIPTINLGVNNTIVDADDTISYTFDVKNTGNVTLTDVTVTDNSLGIAPFNLLLDCGLPNSNNIIDSLGAGATGSCTATYTLTQDDIDGNNIPVITNTAGTIEINNNAEVVGTPPATSSLTPPTALAAATATAQAQAAIALEKTVSGIDDIDGDTLDSVGDEITYTYKVTNIGATTLNDVAITENPLLFSGTGTPSPTDESSTNFSGNSSDAGIDGTWDELRPGDEVIFTYTYTLTQDDINLGSISNTASASGMPPLATELASPSASSSVVLPITRQPSFTLTKTASDTTDVAVGPITYTYIVENTGNTTIDTITIADVHDGNGTSPVPANAVLTNTSGLSSDVAGDAQIDSLAPGDTASFTASYTVTQEDIDIGNDISNTATASGTPKGGILVPAVDSETVDLVDPSPLLTISKTANDTTNVIANQLITYTYIVTNTGKITIDNVTVNDSHSGLGTAPIPANEVLTNTSTLSENITANDGVIDALSPGDIVTFTASYVITQSDIDLGLNVNNTASANGTPKAGAFTPPTNSVSVDLVNQAPAILLTKTFVNADNDGSTSINLNDVLTYTVTATNTGNTTINNVVVTDSKISPNSFSCASLPPVAPGGTVAAINRCVLIGTYTVKQDDVNTGNINNIASVTTANLPNIPNTVVNTPVIQNSSLSIVKPTPDNADEDGSGTITLNDTLTYTITATNNGTVTLNNVVVTDSKISPSSINCPVLNLGDTCVLTGSYQVQQTDVDAGEVDNTASVDSDETGSFDANNKSFTARNPAIAIIKTASVAGGGAVNDIITYTFSVKNMGDVTLNTVVVNDTLTGSVNLPVTPASLLPGETGTAQATYAIKQTDLNTGSVTNSATATGTPTGIGAVSDTSDDDSFTENDSTVTPLTQEPKIAIVKTASIGGTGTGLLNEVITYTFVISNEGNVPLNTVVINDSRISVTNLAVADLAVGTNQTVTATYTIKQSDINLGSISNQATATANSPAGTTSDLSDDDSPLEDQVTLTPLTQAPGIAIIKTAAVTGTEGLGDTITYSFMVTNTGNVPLTGVTIEDTRIDISSLTVPNLGVGQNQTVDVDYIIKQSDIDEGGISN